MDECWKIDETLAVVYGVGEHDGFVFSEMELIVSRYGERAVLWTVEYPATSNFSRIAIDVEVFF